MLVVKSIAGVLAGYVIFAVSGVLLFRIAGRDPHAPQDAGFVAMAVVVGMLFALIGGYVAASIAGRRPILHSAVVAVLIVLGAAVSLVSRPGEGAVWSQLSAIGLMAPCAVLAGILRSKRRLKK